MRTFDLVATWAEVQETRQLAVQRLLMGLLMKRLNVDELRLEGTELSTIARENIVTATVEPDGAMTFRLHPRTPLPA